MSGFDGVAIRDVEFFDPQTFYARVPGSKQNYVVVTIADGEAAGSVVRVIDRCRKTRATCVWVTGDNPDVNAP
jgi:hypothetical protein